MKALLALSLFAALSAQAKEPVVVSSDTGHILSAIYDTENFELRLSDKRILEATDNGGKIKLDGKGYTCEVTHFGATWGDSSMGLDCKATRGKAPLYIRILSDAEDGKISGILLMGPDQDLVQVELNWMDGDERRKNFPEVSLVKFKLVNHSGWIQN